MRVSGISVKDPVFVVGVSPAALEQKFITIKSKVLKSMNAVAMIEKAAGIETFDETGIHETPGVKPIYEDEAPKLGGINSPDESDQIRKIKRLYKMDGTETDDAQEDPEDEEETRRRKEAIFLPFYQRLQSREAPDSPKTGKNEKPDYASTRAIADAAPARQTFNSGYVCMPGSKGACGTCPVYSLMASNVAKLSGRTVPGQFYLTGRNAPKSLMTSFSRFALASV